MTRNLLTILALVLSVGVAVALQANRTFAQTPPQPTPGQPSGVSVSGEGVVTAQPNVARVTLGVDVFNQSLAAAQSDASTRMNAVVEKLKGSGIAESEIRTVSFSINPQYDNRDGQSTVLRGYQVQNMVEVKTANASGLGALLDDVVSAGATRVHGIRFEADNMAQLKDQAREQALRNARAKADQLARGTGVSVGAPILVEDTETGGVTPVRVVAPAAPAVQAATPVQPGELQVRSVVHVTWSIQR